MGTWNAAWELLPKNSESPTEADDNIRAVKGAAERRIRNEHDTYNDATGGAEALDWRHKEGSARCWYEAAEPANSPSAGALAGGHLWWDSDDDELYCYDGAAFQPLNAATSDITTYVDDQSGGSDIKAKVLTFSWNAPYYRVAHGLVLAKIVGIAPVGEQNVTLGIIEEMSADATYIYIFPLIAAAGQTFRATVFYTD